MLKRILFFIIAVFFMAAGNPGYQGAAFVDSGMVQASTTGEIVSLEPPIKDAGGGGLGLEGIIKNVTGFIFWLGIVICPILIVWGGFNIATAGGDEKRFTQGKQIITFAIIGLAIIAVSNAMVAAVQTVLK